MSVTSRSSLRRSLVVCLSGTKGVEQSVEGVSMLGLSLWVWVAVGAGCLVVVLLLVTIVLLYHRNKRIKVRRQAGMGGRDQ